MALHARIGLARELWPVNFFLIERIEDGPELRVRGAHFKNLANSNSGGNGQGNWLNVIPFEPPEGPNSEGTPSSAPANGPDRANHLHYNPYPNTGAPGQPNGCEAGNEKYAAGKTVIGNAAEVWGTTTRGQVKPK